MTMKKYLLHGKRRGVWLVALGALFTAFSLIMLVKTPSLAQYIAPAPAEQQPLDEEDKAAATRGRSALRGLVDSWENNRAELGDVDSGMSATLYNTGVESSASQSDIATITCADAGWFDVYPRYLLSGRLFSQAEHETGESVIVLDKQLAFKLFPTTEPTEGRVMLNGEWFNVIGVVRHSRGAGDGDEYGAYIPLMTAARLGLQTNYVLLSCDAPSMGAVRAMENVADTVVGADGSFYYTDKEVMRVTMILRVVGILAALYVLGYALKVWNRRTAGLINGWREEILHRYFKAILPSVIGWSLVQLLGYGILAAAAFCVLRLIISPMYMFTEWIPEVIVEWNKILTRFKELLTAAAAPVRYQTREYAAIRFYGAFTRWGVICMLLGCMLFKRWDFKWMNRDK